METTGLERPVNPEGQMSAMNLLKCAMKKKGQKPPAPEHFQVARAEHLLYTPVGRDFTILAPGGVKFKVHSAMLLGGSVKLQNYIHPGDVTNWNPPTSVEFPPHMHPMFVDRLVEFTYLSKYFYEKSHIFTYHHATLIPDDSKYAKPIGRLSNLQFHLHMYAMAEDLEYSALKYTAHARLVKILMKCAINPPESVVEHYVSLVYASNSTKICRDEDSALKVLATASAVYHEVQIWSAKGLEVFKESVKGYTQFLADCEALKNQHKDLLGAAANMNAKTANAGANDGGTGKKSGRGDIVKKRKDKKRRQRGNKSARLAVGAEGEEDQDQDIGMDVDEEL